MCFCSTSPPGGNQVDGLVWFKRRTAGHGAPSLLASLQANQSLSVRRGRNHRLVTVQTGWTTSPHLGHCSPACGYRGCQADDNSSRGKCSGADRGLTTHGDAYEDGSPSRSTRIASYEATFRDHSQQGMDGG